MNTFEIIEEGLKPSSQKDGFFFAPARLFLEDGSAFSGLSPQWQKEALFGEVVFTTGMTGYDAALTDPSYARQIVAFTYPIVGSYGVPSKESWESERIYAAGVVVCTACMQWSHGKSMQSLLQWLEVQKVPILMGVDTRLLTKTIRTRGTLRGAISGAAYPPNGFDSPPPELSLPDLVSIKQPVTYGAGKKKIIAVDCGMKKNILRCLQKYDMTVACVPYNFDYTEGDYDGLFLSNGPGNPQDYVSTISILRKAMQRNKPIFGICLGSQLMALAAGAQIDKLKYGHRGYNQPCIESSSGRCFITSQNHGYVVNELSLPKDWVVSFRNLNDNSVEGIESRSRPFFGVQFHPEAAPGPTDTNWLFDTFYNLL